jgi:hypothetical protein
METRINDTASRLRCGAVRMRRQIGSEVQEPVVLISTEAATVQSMRLNLHQMDLAQRIATEPRIRVRVIDVESFEFVRRAVRTCIVPLHVAIDQMPQPVTRVQQAASERLHRPARGFARFRVGSVDGSNWANRFTPSFISGLEASTTDLKLHPRRMEPDFRSFLVALGLRSLGLGKS